MGYFLLKALKVLYLIEKFRNKIDSVKSPILTSKNLETKLIE